MLPDNVRIVDNPSVALRAFLDGRKYTKVALVVDENTERDCYPLVKGALPSHVLVKIQSGEENKNLSTCTDIWRALTDEAFDRKALVVNLGGGVIGDMGGFCAATYKRGIDFVNLPTTLLSQVDASVGGKLGIDFEGFKNHIGVFQKPQAVLISSEFLKTLPFREIRSGYAEILKHALIADASHWEELKSLDLKTADWATVVEHSVAIKSKVVTSDPTEKGLRKILNFGHTIGHAIETFYLDSPDGRLLHGEAIAAGMICESYLSVKKLGLAEEVLEDIVSEITEAYGLHEIPEADFEAIADNTLQDKKNEGGVVMAALLETLGKATFDVALDRAEILDALRYYAGLPVKR
ncbi:3-dehydroquinate synthase [Fulvitalea axinellae]|uniref:3-dehydroquinate synthase n=1 Tax=Fulvitalea axinellae TaxID=1182444 RepID=A0AAU9CK99_9BACT|nr:3-dehydroquinate synthase [Fulvitalea axinellae]